jgi:hypothetical protein
MKERNREKNINRISSEEDTWTVEREGNLSLDHKMEDPRKRHKKHRKTWKESDVISLSCREDDVFLQEQIQKKYAKQVAKR